MLVIGKEAPAVDADLTHRGAGMMMQGAGASLPSHASQEQTKTTTLFCNICIFNVLTATNVSVYQRGFMR